ncbi:hypothetical protein [Rhizobium sp. 18065]|uniref:hypothetical protein n=1 Tax=Rhizobium sp. 18065 TaxID=2681411 RepID=UPI0013596AC1|nr:hypothetical protein [Rhizobium sp. 18065]
MTKLEQIEKSVAELSSKDLAAFSDWFDSFQAARWDRQIEEDDATGKLDKLAKEVLVDFRAGKTRPL